MSEEKIGSVSLISDLTKKLTGMIISGELPPGDKLPPEREFAETLGVSRSTLHQALVALEAHGLIEVIPRQGAFVEDIRKNPTTNTLTALMSYSTIDLDKELFEDMMDTRIWLEKECVRRACSNIDAMTIIRLERLLMAMEGKKPDWANLVYTFHYTLVQASGNSIFAMIYRGFEDVIKLLIKQHYVVEAEDYKTDIEWLRELLKAVEENKPELASELVEKIISNGVGVLRRKYE